MNAFLGKQVEEQQYSQKQDLAEEIAYAQQQQAQLQTWQQQQEQKAAGRKDAMQKLKVRLLLLCIWTLPCIS